MNGKIVPLHYELQSGDIVEILTSKRERGPSRDWLALVKTTRARNKIKAWFKAESRDDSEHTGRELLQEHLNKAGPAGPEADRLAAAGRRDPRARLQEGRRLLHRARRREDLARRSSSTRSCSGSSRARPASRSRRPARTCCSSAARRPALRRPDGNAAKFGIRVEGVTDVPLRLAKCCRPVSGDPIVGYVSLGRGITIHRDDCPNVAALRKDPERFVPGVLGRRQRDRLQGRDPGRRVGPPPPARGPVTDLRRGRDQHRRGPLPRPAPDDPQPVRDRGGGHAGAEVRDQPPARDRLRLRRLPRHTGRAASGRAGEARTSSRWRSCAVRSGRSAAATTCGSFGWGCWFFMQVCSPQRPV